MFLEEGLFAASARACFCKLSCGETYYVDRYFFVCMLVAWPAGFPRVAGVFVMAHSSASLPYIIV